MDRFTSFGLRRPRLAIVAASIVALVHAAATVAAEVVADAAPPSRNPSGPSPPSAKNASRALRTKSPARATIRPTRRNASRPFAHGGRSQSPSP